ncbi:MAG: SDR family NAD(P)-dependent oxidoreductase [Streptosporangiaceae bacterium]
MNEQQRFTGDGTLAGQVAVVTGASRGIGAAIARTLAGAGASVAVNYAHGRDDAGALVGELERTGARAIAAGGDVRDETDMGELARRVGETLGPVDVLVCSAAGMGGRAPAPGPLIGQDPGVVAGQVAAQLAAVLVPARAFAPAMAARGGGRLVAIGSGWSRRPVEGFAHVGIAKAAADAAVRSLALELGPSGVRANVVAPGFVHTARSEALPEPARRSIVERTPLRRAAEPADIAAAVLALLGPGARHLTGAWLPVDGGLALT